MKKISIVTGTYNEEENVKELYKQVKDVMEQKLPEYTFEHIFIDNSSEDKTVEILKDMAREDKRIKIIVNSRNFGHIRSPVYGLMQATGDAVIMLVADLQDPPSMIETFVKEWEDGNDVVLAIKKTSQENSVMFKIREVYYNILERFSEVQVFKNNTGFGLYDRKVMDGLIQIGDPYPFLRGIVAEVGYKVKKIPYDQPVRIKGFSKNNFYTLYDIGMLGIINNSKVPLRIAVFVGFIFSALSFLTGIVYFILKLIFWEEMTVGIAPLVIGGSFMFSLLLFFMGIIGEYVGAIYTQVLNRPMVFEKERINFDD